MDPKLALCVDKDTPKLNVDLANGIARKHCEQLESYLDTVWRAAAKDFPPGLTFEGFRRMTPNEELRECTRKRNRNNKSTYDVARTDFYMIEQNFSWHGKPLTPRPLYLPFVGPGGTITIGGSRFVISPVASDQVISKGVTSIFVRLLRDRLTFERAPHHYKADGVRETVQVAWSMIYHKNAKMRKLRPTIVANCTLAHYLFAKFGVTEAFERFGNTRPIVGTSEINTQDYPPDEWVICSSIQVKPKGVGRNFWQPSNLRMAIKREDYTPMVRSLVAGFFYVVDHFPDRVLPEYVDSQRLWKVLLGHILFSSTINEGKLHDDINDHIMSLDEYVDNYITAELRDLKEIKEEVTNIYQLFAIIIENFNDWIMEASDKISSMWDKKFNVLYYLMYEVTSAIFLLYYRLKAASKKELTENEINAALQRTLRPGLIYSITRQHGEVSTVNSSGDNMALRMTSLLVPQSSSSKNARKDRTGINDPSKFAHPSLMEVCGYLALPKSAPDGRSRLNLHVKTDHKWVVQRNPKFQQLLDEIWEIIKR